MANLLTECPMYRVLNVQWLLAGAPWLLLGVQWPFLGATWPFLGVACSIDNFFGMQIFESVPSAVFDCAMSHRHCPMLNIS